MKDMAIDGFQSLCSNKAKKIVSRDKGETRKHVAQNTNSFYVAHYRVDGCLITTGNRCDFLLLNEDKKKAYLIELKGHDLHHAAVQIEKTQQMLSKELSEYSKEYRIVASKCRTQAIESSDFKRYRIRWGKSLKYKTNSLEEVI